MSEHSAAASWPCTETAAHAAVPGKKYLYAVIPGTPNPGCSSAGIGAAEVYTITEGRLSAVVSDVSHPRLRPERRHLAAHQAVLRQLMARTSTLPISFGTLADSPAAVRKILSRNQAALAAQLHRVADKVEMGLHLTWEVPNIFEYFVGTHPELRAARDRFFGGGHQPAQDDKLAIGRLFERLLQEDRETHTENVEAALAPHCFEIKRDKCRSEREVMNLNCLVGRAGRAGFEAAVQQAAQRFDDHFAFDYNGPWPPYNFVEIDLRI